VEGISLHAFPAVPSNSSNLGDICNNRTKWQVALQIGKRVPNDAHVCSIHFEENDFKSKFLFYLIQLRIYMMVYHTMKILQ